jgi:hypothetical protein
MKLKKLVEQVENDRDGFVVDAEVLAQLVNEMSARYILVRPELVARGVNPLALHELEKDFAADA